jgi:hypothetical protein
MIYRFNNFEMAIDYIRLLDLNVRDENQILVPTSIFEERFDIIIEEFSFKYQKNKLKFPNLSWISYLLIDLGNIILIEKGNNIY